MFFNLGIVDSENIQVSAMCISLPFLYYIVRSFLNLHSHFLKSFVENALQWSPILHFNPVMYFGTYHTQLPAFIFRFGHN